MSSTHSTTLKITPFVREYCGCSMLSWNRLCSQISACKRWQLPSRRDPPYLLAEISGILRPLAELSNRAFLFLMPSLFSLPLVLSFFSAVHFFRPTARPHRLQWGGWQSNVLRDCSFSVLFPFDFSISSYAGTTQHASRLTRPPAIPLAKTKGVLRLSG